MYAFVSFMRGVCEETLVQSLCKIRIDSLRLHANPVRHLRPVVKQHVIHGKVSPIPLQHVLVGKTTYAKGVNGKHGQSCESKTEAGQASSISTDSKVMRENAYPYALLRCYKDF